MSAFNEAAFDKWLSDLQRVRRFLSLGAGVQSSTLYLMAVNGVFGDARPEAAIFADTGWEPVGVYAQLDALEQAGGTIIPIHRVSVGNIRTDALSAAKRFASMPLVTINRKGTVGRLRRQCTREYKVDPVNKAIRTLLGVKPRARVRVPVEVWLGISKDEVGRMKPSREGWKVNRWPLIERGLRRSDCLAWMAEHGYPEPPKSACIGCPYTDDKRWREMQLDRPAEFADAVAFDTAVRHLPRLKNGGAFLHRSARPLGEIDFRSQTELGQDDLFGEFGEECEGMCGV